MPELTCTRRCVQGRELSQHLIVDVSEQSFPFHTVGYVVARQGPSYAILCEYLCNCNEKVISSVEVYLQCMQGHRTVFSV